MTYVLRLSAFLLACVSFNLSASIISVEFDGFIEYLNDPLNKLSAHNISTNDPFNANFRINSNTNSFNSFDSFYAPLKVYEIDTNSVELTLDFGLSQETQPAFFQSYIVIANDLTWDAANAQSDPNLPDIPGGDVWGIEVVYSEPSNLDFALMFVDSTSTLLSNDDFFINDSLSLWDFAYFNLGEFGEPYNVIAQGTTTIPLPAGISLFLSGLVSLGFVKGKKKISLN